MHQKAMKLFHMAQAKDVGEYYQQHAPVARALLHQFYFRCMGALFEWEPEDSELEECVWLTAVTLLFLFHVMFAYSIRKCPGNK